MREIKFNAWNKEAKTMHYDILNPNNFSFSFLNMKIYEWIQFTGEKDIKGKDAYSGDIIENANCDKRIIQWCLTGFEMRLLDGSKDKIDNVTWWFNFEIIGNIYTTPELLNN